MLQLISHILHTLMIVNSLTVSTRISDDDFDLSLATLKFLCLNLHNLVLWAPAFVLAIALRFITHKYHHQLIFPLCKSSEIVTWSLSKQ